MSINKQNTNKEFSIAIILMIVFLMILAFTEFEEKESIKKKLDRIESKVDSLNKKCNKLHFEK